MNDLKFGKTLISASKLTERIHQLAAQISSDYRGREILAVGVLNGAVMFYGELLKQVTVPVTLDFIRVKSYAGRTSTGEVRVVTEPEHLQDVTGRHILLVEDIVDSGATVRYLRKLFLARKPASIATCTLLDKPTSRRIKVPVEYIGFAIPEVFVVGFGMDYRERYRNLPYISVLENKEAVPPAP